MFFSKYKYIKNMIRFGFYFIKTVTPKTEYLIRFTAAGSVGQLCFLRANKQLLSKIKTLN